MQLPITMYCDNQAKIHIALNLAFCEWTKGIKVDCHLVQERLERGVIATPYVSIGAKTVNLFFF